MDTPWGEPGTCGWSRRRVSQAFALTTVPWCHEVCRAKDDVDACTVPKWF